MFRRNNAAFLREHFDFCGDVASPAWQPSAMRGSGHEIDEPVFDDLFEGHVRVAFVDQVVARELDFEQGLALGLQVCDDLRVGQ